MTAKSLASVFLVAVIWPMAAAAQSDVERPSQLSDAPADLVAQYCKLSAGEEEDVFIPPRTPHRPIIIYCRSMKQLELASSTACIVIEDTIDRDERAAASMVDNPRATAKYERYLKEYRAAHRQYCPEPTS